MHFIWDTSDQLLTAVSKLVSGKLSHEKLNLLEFIVSWIILNWIQIEVFTPSWTDVDIYDPKTYSRSLTQNECNGFTILLITIPCCNCWFCFCEIYRTILISSKTYTNTSSTPTNNPSQRFAITTGNTRAGTFVSVRYVWLVAIRFCDALPTNQL